MNKETKELLHTLNIKESELNGVELVILESDMTIKEKKEILQFRDDYPLNGLTKPELDLCSPSTKPSFCHFLNSL